MSTRLSEHLRSNSWRFCTWDSFDVLRKIEGTEEYKIERTSLERFDSLAFFETLSDYERMWGQAKFEEDLRTAVSYSPSIRDVVGSAVQTHTPVISTLQSQINSLERRIAELQLQLNTSLAAAA